MRLFAVDGSSFMVREFRQPRASRTLQLLQADTRGASRAWAYGTAALDAWLRVAAHVCRHEAGRHASTSMELVHGLPHFMNIDVHPWSDQAPRPILLQDQAPKSQEHLATSVSAHLSDQLCEHHWSHHKNDVCLSPKSTAISAALITIRSGYILGHTWLSIVVPVWYLSNYYSPQPQS